ncbi:MAG: TlpA disulfide reductase family protein [Betaproteobacteria bacterium]
MLRPHQFVAVVACVAITALPLSQNACAVELKRWTGGKTPPLSLKDLQGQPRSLDQFKGKVIVVNFWATWCEPCVEEMPSLQSLKDRIGEARMMVLGVNLGEGEARIKSFTNKTGAALPILLDRDGVAKKNWRVNGVPATFVLDTKGHIRYTFVGAVDFGDKKIEAQIMGLMPKK